ncbi:MAG: hypothetical protein HQL87_09835 [Magnetococcales bacterium]|nr:hypothetical protein [Magnetococcales bacterium]
MTNTTNNGYQQEPRAKLGGLYEKTSAKGLRYFVGYFGGFKLLMMPNDKAAQGEPEWNLFAVERAPKDGTASTGTRTAQSSSGNYQGHAYRQSAPQPPRQPEPPMPDYPPEYDPNDVPY